MDIIFNTMYMYLQVFLTHIYVMHILLIAVLFLPSLSVYRMNINFCWKEIQIFKQIINKTFVDILIYTP